MNAKVKYAGVWYEAYRIVGDGCVGYRLGSRLGRLVFQGDKLLQEVAK